ncbi:MAG: NAD-dependent epimerase/dehydratase family protein [Bradymonadaceae bacterium]|nr:NAD-dependent epimerase/dehydratase family protein [Lujinxingiaceae bacterium]
MRVFVTGATGFVGSHVVERLLKGGHDPVCLVRPSSNTAHLQALGVETFEGSMSRVAGLEQAVAGVDAVVHIAGIIKARSFDEFYAVNGEATGALVRLVAQVNPGLQRFVAVSSIAAQGPSAGRQARPLERTCEPVSHYGKSKLAGETAVLELADQMAVTVVRPPAVYGPRDYEMLQVFRMASYGVAPVYGDGSGLLSIIHAFDLADAIVSCIDHPHDTGSVFTVDDGQIYTWNELGEHVAAGVGKGVLSLKVPPLLFRAAANLSEIFGRVTKQAVIFNRDKLAEMRQDSWVCGHAAIAEAIGWTPQWPLAKGAEQTAAWYREAGWI